MEKEIISTHDQHIPYELPEKLVNVTTEDLISMTTSEFAVFEIMFDVLNKFTNEIIISFRSDGIKIIVTDEQQFFESHGSIMFFVKIDSDKLENYQTRSTNNNIKFNLNALCEFIKIGKHEKQINRSDIFSIRVDNTKIYFNFVNKHTKSTITHNQHILNDTNTNYNFPTNTTFEKLITMNCITFFKTCKMLISDNATLSCSDTFVIDNGSSLRSFQSGDHVRIISLNPHNNTTLIGNYNLNHIVKCDRLSHLCAECQIFLKHDYPMFINITLGSIGKLLIGISPNE